MPVGRRRGRVGGRARVWRSEGDERVIEVDVFDADGIEVKRK